MQAPFTDGRYIGGGGWIFPKRSPLLPILHKYYWELKEKGFQDRLSRTPERSPSHLLPDQECDTLEGHPISMHKVISVVAMFFGGFCLSLMIFGYVKSNQQRKSDQTPFYNNT